MKPVFEADEHFLSGALAPVAQSILPIPAQMACLYTHRRDQDPKTRLFMEFTSERVGDAVKRAETQVFTAAIGGIDKRREQQWHVAMCRL